MRLGFAVSPGARRVATSSAPAVVATDPLVTVLGVAGATVTVSISTGGSMVTVTGTLDASGMASILPPYSVQDGARQVTATQTIGGVVSPPSAPAVLSMPNAAKSQVLDIISRMSVPPPAGRAEVMYAYIAGQMAAGIWSAWDVFCPLAAHDAQATRVNWISAAYGLSLYNTVIFRANRSLQGDGSMGYLEAAGYNPSTATLRLTRDSMSLGAWVLTPASAVVGLDVYGGNSRVQRRLSGSNDIHYRANDGTSTNWPSGGAMTGLFVTDRPDAATKLLYRNGTLIHSASVASTGNSNILRVFAAGSGRALSDAELALVCAGRSLTEAQHAAFAALSQTYFATVGAIAA